MSNPPALYGTSHWPRILRLWRSPGVGELVMGATTKGLLARTLRRGSAFAPGPGLTERLSAVWDQFDQGTQRAILRLVRSATDDMIGGSGPRTPGGEEAHGGGEGRAPSRAGQNGNASGFAFARPVIIWGEEDPWYPPAVADAYAVRLPGATVERIAGAGHWPWLDRPEVVDRVAALLEG